MFLRVGILRWPPLGVGITMKINVEWIDRSETGQCWELQNVYGRALGFVTFENLPGREWRAEDLVRLNWFPTEKEAKAWIEQQLGVEEE